MNFASERERCGTKMDKGNANITCIQQPVSLWDLPSRVVRNTNYLPLKLYNHSFKLVNFRSMASSSTPHGVHH